jgi:hypothetical protein
MARRDSLSMHHRGVRARGGFISSFGHDLQHPIMLPDIRRALLQGGSPAAPDDYLSAVYPEGFLGR